MTNEGNLRWVASSVPAQRRHPRLRRVGKRKLVPVVLVALAVAVVGAAVAVAAVLLFGGSDAPVFVDRFSRTDDATVLGGRGHRWTTLSGTWGLRNADAVVTTPGDPWSLAVVERRVSDGRVSARLPHVVSGQGIAFRVKDADNFVALVAVPGYSTWNLFRVLDGKAELITNTGLSVAEGRMSVAVVLHGTRIDIYLGGGELVETVNLQELAHATKAGLAKLGASTAPDARWSVFSASLAD